MLSHAPLLLDASVTESLANFATKLIDNSGYLGVAVLIFISSLVILPGTEVTMLFGGFSVDNATAAHVHHHMSLFGLIAIAAVVDVIGGIIVYWVAYFGAVEVLNRLPGPLNVSNHGLDRAHRWMERWGVIAVFITRILPTVRAGGPWAAGVAKMPFWRYLAALIAGTVVWMTALGFVGKAVGRQWPKWKSHLDIVDYVAVAFVACLVVWFLYEKVYKPWAENRSQAGIGR